MYAVEGNATGGGAFNSDAVDDYGFSEARTGYRIYILREKYQSLRMG